MFGPEDRLFNRFAAMGRMSPVLPLIGGGRTNFQPVYVGDVAGAIAAACAGKARPHTIYELGGSEVLSLREMFERALKWPGRRRLFLDVPFWLAQLTALMTAPLPASWRPSTSTRSVYYSAMAW